MEREPTDNMCSEGFRSGKKYEMISLENPKSLKDRMREDKRKRVETESRRQRLFIVVDWITSRP